MPDFYLENDARSRFGSNVAGVDEAGRGPLAGPVVAGAALLDPDLLPDVLLHGLNDSKKLSASRRDALFSMLTSSLGVVVSVGIASVEEIDGINILRATHLAMARAVNGLGVCLDVALIDGNQAPKSFPCPVMCVVKGDSLSLSIAAASIMAKVTRDRMMEVLSADFPAYGWDRNMGYGTAAHREAITRHGPTPHHRRSFAGQGSLFESV
ncbi:MULTISPECIES: ribonuclease HII [unclassified Haematospirillum]|uniref:ribonuclease HII n=1 Tax=unclassified Haematospirillum TaxID=2622088 RepID=UPI00143967A3|nr:MULTISPECIES: ribonuclease HII [unclassified Haematospirillum]NKD55805.1 ribonuclease HII [Haematospirillum sp. H4890]NKD75884.1 ribonuclease HII [Haematospirillum sp. H4485]